MSLSIQDLYTLSVSSWVIHHSKATSNLPTSTTYEHYSFSLFHSPHSTQPHRTTYLTTSIPTSCALRSHLSPSPALILATVAHQTQVLNLHQHQCDFPWLATTRARSPVMAVNTHRATVYVYHYSTSILGFPNTRQFILSLYNKRTGKLSPSIGIFFFNGANRSSVKGFIANTYTLSLGFGFLRNSVRLLLQRHYSLGWILLQRFAYLVAS
jgi:hypothetical protein